MLVEEIRFEKKGNWQIYFLADLILSKTERNTEVMRKNGSLLVVNAYCIFRMVDCFSMEIIVSDGLNFILLLNKQGP